MEVNVGKVGEILNERPEGMSYEDYRVKRKEQTMMLKGYNTFVGKERVHVMGRLEGVHIPSGSWTNSKDVKVVIR